MAKLAVDFSPNVACSGLVKICLIRYQWKDLSSLILVITILESLMGPGRNNMRGFILTKKDQSGCQRVKLTQ